MSAASLPITKVSGPEHRCCSNCSGRRETLGDELFPIPNNRPVLPEEVELRIRKATAYVHDSAGVQPVSFRCPRCDDWLEKGDMRILEVPNFADMLMESSDIPLERDRDHWPLFRTGDGEEIYRCVENFLEFIHRRLLTPVLGFYFHPWEFIDVEESYTFGECTVIPDPFITSGCGEPALERLSKLIDYFLVTKATFIRADELARPWKDGNYPRLPKLSSGNHQPDSGTPVPGTRRLNGNP